MSNDAPLSQTQLVWRRFKRQRLGFFSGVVVLVLAVFFLLADFIAPYNYAQQHRRASYVAPMLTRVHLFDENGLRLPFVYALKRERDPNRALSGVWHYAEERSESFPIRWFVKGEAYQLWGLIPLDVHLFGLGTPPNSPGQLFLLGTNQTGQDLFSQIMVGGRLSLGLGPLVIFSSFLLGIVVGGLSGYWGGWVDTALQRLVEITMGLPRLALLLALSAAIPSNAAPMTRYWAIAGVLVLVSWAPLARVIRGQFLALREEDFVVAARATGASGARIIGRHILPSTTSYLVVSATLAIPNVLILESVLSFFGFGLHTPMISWGLLLKQVQDNLVTHLSFQPWLLLPGAFLFFTVLAFNFTGDALRDAVDPFAVDVGTQR